MVKKKQYKEIPCRECGIIFLPGSGSQKTCGPECREIRNKRWQAEYRKRFKGRGRGSTHEPSVHSKDLAGRPRPKARKKRIKCKCGRAWLNPYNHTGICGACEVERNGHGFVATEIGDIKVNPL